jgi:hypothetical protein
MFKKYYNTFVEFSFSPIGTGVWATIGGGIMAILTYLTTALQQYSPLSYGIAVFFGLISTLIVIRLILSAWLSFSQRLYTNKPTFVEYKIDNRRINLVRKSNMYREPSVVLEDIKPSQQNRKQRRADQSNNNEQPDIISARINAIFERPITSSSMHLKIESISGQCPTRENSIMDERYGNLTISNIKDGSYFRICFNDNQE